MKSLEQYCLFGATGPPDVAPPLPAERPGNLVFLAYDWAERMEAFSRGQAAAPAAFESVSETPQRGPESARCPQFKEPERVEVYEKTHIDRHGLQSTVRVTVRYVRVPRPRKRQLLRS